MKKILIRIVLVLAVLLVASVIAVSLLLDKAIKKGVETFGPRITQVAIKLDGVKLSILSGAGEISGLEVGNPEGYKSPQAIKLGSASLAIDPSSLLADKVVVKHIRIAAPEITIEGTPKNNNLTKILENVQQSTGGSSTNQTAEPTASGPGKKLQVDEFTLTGAKVTYIVGGQTLQLTVPDIKLTDLGTGPEGITGGELTDLALSKLLDAIIPVLTEQAGKLGKQAVDATLDKAVNKAAQSLDGLFKKQP
jgi:uncharacterized protein involved in outer membrane biogenesis